MRRKRVTEEEHEPGLLRLLQERDKSVYIPLEVAEREILGMRRSLRKKPGGKLRHASRARSSR